MNEIHVTTIKKIFLESEWTSCYASRLQNQTAKTYPLIMKDSGTPRLTFFEGVTTSYS